MSLAFDPQARLIIIPVRIWGTAGDIVIRLALDTRATRTVINWDTLVVLGYDPAATRDRRQITTGSGVEFAASVQVRKLEALENQRVHFPVLCYTLPPRASVDGLLGLDFMRGHRLVVDFKAGRLNLA